MGKSIASIDITLASQNVSLVDHIRRTELLEEAFKNVDQKVDENKKEMEELLKPLSEHVTINKAFRKGFIAVLGLILAAAGAYASWLAVK